jgi:hypothetical protein
MPANPSQGPDNIVAYRNRALEAKKAAQRSADRDAERTRIRTNVAALIMAAVLVGLGWYLVDKLGASVKMQDCLMSGRTNCNPIPESGQGNP